MEKTLKILALICILISITSYAFASYTAYEAEEYIIKIENIDEQIEKIDLVSFEKCDMEETGGEYTTSFEIVPLFGKDNITHLDKHDTENYYIKQTVRYNYLAGTSAQNIESTSVSGKYSEFDEDGNLITYDLAREERFNNSYEFHDYSKIMRDNEIYEYYENTDENELICVKTTNYEAYKITPIKEIDVSEISNNKLVYNHEDYSNLKIGIRIKNASGGYKTFISNDNSMYMTRYGAKPIIDKEKITIFDYSTVTYEDNAEYSFKIPVKTNDQLLSLIIIVAVIFTVIIITFVILNIILKKKKSNK